MTKFAVGTKLNMDRFTGLAVFAKVVEAANFAAAGVNSASYEPNADELIFPDRCPIFELEIKQSDAA